jgi:hypothetical protein
VNLYFFNLYSRPDKILNKVCTLDYSIHIVLSTVQCPSGKAHFSKNYAQHTFSFFALCTVWQRIMVRRACNLTAFIHSSTGPVVHPFASHHEGPVFYPCGVLITYVKLGFSC